MAKNEFLIPPGEIPGAEAKQKAILEEALRQQRGELPPGTFLIGGRGISSGEFKRRIKEAQAKQRALEEKIRIEEKRKKAEALEKVKQESIKKAKDLKAQRQREAIEKRARQLKEQGAQIEKARLLTRKQKKQFFLDQATVLKAERIQRQKLLGKKLTPEAKRTIEEAKKIKKRKPEIITKKALPPEKLKIEKQKELRFTQKVIRKNIALLKELKVSKKIIKDFKEGTTPLEIRIKTLPISQNKKDKLLKIVEVEKELAKGFIKGIIEEPEKIAIVAAASILAPVVLARLGGKIAAARIIKPILKRVPKSVKKRGGQAVSKFLTASYLTGTGLSIAATEKGKRAEKTGRILSTEVVPFKIGSRIGVQGLLRNEIKKDLKKEVAKLSPEKRAAFEDYMKQAEVFGKFEPKARNLKLNNIESIKDKKAQSILRKFLTKNKEEVIVGGSVAQTGQVSIKRKLGDVDLYLEGRLKPNQAAKQLVDKLKKAGVKRVSQPIKKGKLQPQVTIEGKKAIEFHDVDRVLRNIEEVIPAWQNARKYIIKTPEGIKIQRIGLQARRKLVAAFADPKRFATGKYKKDLKDFKKIADQLFGRAEKNARQSFFFKKKKIKGIERIFKKKIPSPKIKKPKPKKLKIVKKKVFKKVPKKITKRKKTKAEIKEERLKNLKKARKVKKAKKKIKPSQKPTRPRKPKKIRPSQKPTKKKKRKPSPPSQPPTKRPPKKPPKPPKKPSPPSQPPTKRPPKKPSPPSQPPTIRPPKRPPKPPKEPPKPFPRKKKKRKVSIKIKLKQAYDVKARPLKRPGQKKRPKLIKINKRPLSRRNAKRLGSTITDETLSRTFKIKKARGKPKSPTFKTKKFQKQKFRKFRIVKGKKVPLKNTFIEKSKSLIDTKGEKKGLTLRAGIKRLQKQKVRVRKPTRISQGKKIKRTIRKSKNRTSTTTKTEVNRPVKNKSVKSSKRKVSQQVLDNLAKGRAKRLANLKKR